MEIVVTIVSFGLVVGIIGTPILILVRLSKQNVRYRFVAFLLVAVIISVIFTLMFAWWANVSNEILLWHYGYDFEAMTDAERFKDVSKGNTERVRQLEISMTGIGWPLKASMIYLMYSPYLLVVYLIAFAIQKYGYRVKGQN